MITWHFNKADKDGPAAAEIGNLCLWASQINACFFGRWVWTGDLPNEAGDGIRIRPPIHGIAGSRDEAIADANQAVRLLLKAKLEIVK